MSTRRAAGFYDDKSNNPFSKEFWIKRGYTKEEATQLLKNKANRSVATKKIAGFYDDKSNNPFSKEFWIKNGNSEEEADSLIRSKNHNCVEYWIDRGYPAYTAEVLAKASADTNSLISKTKKYGVDIGILKYAETSRKSSESWNVNSTGHWNFGTSKKSLIFFRKLYKYLRRYGISRESCQSKLANGTEFYLSDKKDNGKKNIFFYDFTIHSHKIIIEYNGEHVHPDVETLNENELLLWRHAFNKKTANEIIEYDNRKSQLANANGV